MDKKVTIKEKALGSLEKGFARIKVKACAICATDLEVIDGNIPAKYPLTPGHEWSGVVVEVADEKNKNLIVKDEEPLEFDDDEIVHKISDD